MKKVNKFVIVGKSGLLGILKWKIFLKKEELKLKKNEDENFRINFFTIAQLVKFNHKNFNPFWS